MAMQPTHAQPDFPAGLLGLADGAAIVPPLPFGPFLLHRVVRKSNMSLLCDGTHCASQKRVAVKLCLPQADRKRFLREIELTRSIRTAGVIKVLNGNGVGETKDGCPFYATLWVEGPTLGEFLQDEAPSLDEKLDVFEQLCRTMGLLHHERWDGQPMTHRDLKPSNVKVVLDADGRRPVLLDWGLACAEGGHDLTISGAHPGGTPGYYPPWSTKEPRWVKAHGKCWDVYSLGVILVEVLTQARPADAHDPNFTPDGVKKLLRERLPNDRRFDDLLARCLAPNPKTCPPSAEALLNDLRACRGLRRPPARKWRYAGAALLAGLLLAAGHEVFRAAAPDTYAGLVSSLRRAWERPPDPPPPEPPPLPRNPQIISWTNFTLRLTVSPPGAEVRVINHRANGALVTNLTVPPAGQMEIPLPDDPEARYSVMVLLRGYHPLTQPVDPDSGPLTIRLEKLRGEVEFLTTAAALIHLRHEGGETRTAGPVPAAGKLLVQSLDEGTWDWQIRLPDYETNSGRIPSLEHGKPQKVDRPLKPLPGRLSVVGHHTMSVWAGATRLGAANEWIPLPAGTHDLRLLRPGFKPQTLRVDMPPNRDLSRVASNFVAEAGALRLTVDVPAAATEYFAQAAKRLLLDGVPLAFDAFPHLVEDVSVGQHTLRLEIEGFVPVEQSGVPIRDGQTNELRLTLQPLPGWLTVVASPPNAEVHRAGGGRLGPAGAALELPALQPLALEVRAPRHGTALLNLPPLAPGGSNRHEVNLLPIIDPVPPTPKQPYINTLGQKFVPVPGTAVLFCIWETRVQDYELFATETQRAWQRASFTQDSNHPAVNVSWADAKAFCQWLTERERKAGLLPEGWEYRLPTDAEWSLAVGLANERGASPEEKDGKIKEVYPWGKQWPPPRRAGNYASSLKVDDFEYTSPVGSFASNQFGLHDMGGNVWEWCEDWYDSAQRWRVLRGASWGRSDPGALLSSYRRDCASGLRYRYLGFRVVLAGVSSR